MEYGYYRDSFGGRRTPEEDFPGLVKKAEAFVRYMTGNKAEADQSDAFKDAVCAVCDVYAADDAQVQAQGDGREVASENNDGYSVSYVTEGQAGQTHEETLRRKAYQAAYPYLAFTGLLNRRVRHARQCGHYHL